MQPKPRKKSTPIRNALFWISTTSCLWMATLLYGVYDGQIVRTNAMQVVMVDAPQEVAHGYTAEEQAAKNSLAYLYGGR